MKLFKVKTNYAKLNKESENGSEKVSEIRLFEAIDYIDAQKQAIECINKNGCMGECEVEIQKVSYDAVIKKPSEGEVQLNFVNEDIYWYEIRITRIVINDKDEEKYVTSKFIVEGEDLEDALDVVRDYLKDEDEDDWWFTSATETPISEIIEL